MMVELDADGRRSPVEHEVDAIAEIGDDMRGRGGRDVAGAIGRGRHDRFGEGGEQGARDRVGRHAHRDRVESGGGEIGDRAAGPLRQHERQRSRPERGGKLVGRPVETGELPRGGGIDHVGDERVE